MSDLAIKVEGLSKRYRIGQYVGRAYQYRALRDILTDAMYVPFRRLRARIKRRTVGSNPTTMTHEPSANLIWALKDVSFQVKQGEVVGIIGRNGAGKTTLLKLLSRITEPTEGRAEIKGRVGSLLEVGTGFHPDLTGRENIYLSGAILGMTKKEIDRKFDEIVAFAELKKFIDTPIKRYSSGMWIRLGFAVAAHLEPEILLVDEVLAVGDVVFQKRCLGKMGDVAKEGRTVLFVSHNMSMISQLCRSAIELGNGRLVAEGNAAQVVGGYLAKFETEGFSLKDSKFVKRAELITCNGNNVVGFGNALILAFEFDFPGSLSSLGLSIQIVNDQNVPVLHLTPFDQYHELALRGPMRLRCSINEQRLNIGKYWCNINISEGIGRNRIEFVERAFGFEIIPSNKLARHWPPWPSDCLWVAESDWTISSLHEGSNEL